MQNGDEEDKEELLSVILDIDWFYSRAAPGVGLMADALISDEEVPISLLIRQVIRRVEGCRHGGTDGTVVCPHCGMSATRFISDARDWLDDNEGMEVEDPGYFTED